MASIRPSFRALHDPDECVGGRPPCRRARLLSGICAALLVCAVAGSATGDPMIMNLYPTGFGFTSGSVLADSQDGSWKVAAWAAGGTFQPGYTPTGTAPFAAYVYESNVASPLGIPEPWLGGTANNGFAGGLWIGAQNSPFGLINSPTSVHQGDFRSSMVFSTNFLASSTGLAHLDFWAASDNAVAFFVGGTVTTSTNVVDSGTMPLEAGWQLSATGSNFPTIVGGTQIGFGRGFASLTHYTGYANVTSGSNTLYAVLYDSSSGSNNWTGFMLTPVPEPSSVVLAAIACGCIAFGHARSRRRRDASAGPSPHEDEPAIGPPTGHDARRL
jgi:hypothetical protein